MTVNKQDGLQLVGASGRKFSFDLRSKQDTAASKPLVIFLHGFKGFKDWGNWNTMADQFAAHGFCFVKFNFSHNGISDHDLISFSDLEAFGQNNFSKELMDLQILIDHLKLNSELRNIFCYNPDEIYLIGHSRGGPIALITALERDEVKKAITWASVHELNYSWEKDPEKLSNWEKEGVVYILNGRTKQNMPLYFQLYEDYLQNSVRFNIQKTLARLQKPVLFIHGSADPAVPLDALYYLAKNSQQGSSCIIEEANHVFGAKHPAVGNELSDHEQELLKESISFLKDSVL